MDTQDITKDQFKQMFDYAKANPNEPSSQMFAKKIQAGDFNQFGSYKPKPVAPQPTTTTPATSTDRLKGEVSDVSNFVKKLGSHYAENVKSGYMNAIPDFIDQATKNDASTSQNKVVRTGENTLGATVSGLNTVFTPVTAWIKAIGDTVVDPNNEAIQKFASHPAVSKVLDYITGKSDQIEQTHPEAARNIVNAITLATAMVGGEKAGVDKPITTVADMKAGASDAITKVNDSIPGMIEGAGTKINAVKQGVKDIAKNTKQKFAVDTTKETLKSIEPELSGKALDKAYTDIAKGTRTADESGLLKRQTISPEQRIVERAQRLSDIGLKPNDHIANLEKLNTALKDTESKLVDALKGDPEIEATAQKDVLYNKLNELKTRIPQEYRIGDAGKLYSDGVEYAKTLIKDKPDTITGLRQARSEFDAQARTQYPNAFKDGRIDTKTASGQLVKDIRDTLNDHLYETAPNGSEIQQLIRRESDILSASESVGTKAASGHGMNKIEKLKKTVKDNPVTSSLVGGAAILETKHLLGL